MGYRNYGPANGFIVSQDGNGDFTTIGAALAVAPSGTTIFIKPGTYTENPALVAGVNLCAWQGDADTPNVIINGKCTYSSAGTVTISNIQLQTNMDYLLVVSGMSASVVNLNNCYLNMTNNTGISFTSSSSSSSIYLTACEGNVGTTGIAIYASSSAGALSLDYCLFNNSGGSTTANTISAGIVLYHFSNTRIPIVLSGTASIEYDSSIMNLVGFAAVCITQGGSGATQNVINSYFLSGSSTAISVSAGKSLAIYNCVISSTNTNAISGAGSITTGGIIYSGTSALNAVSTQAGGAITGFQSTLNQSPSAGYIGEQIRSTVAVNSASLSNNSAANITSISLTTGIWDVSGLVTFSGGAITGTNFAGSISLTSATRGTQADAEAEIPTPPTAASNVSVSIPSLRVVVYSSISPKTVYLVGYSTYSMGSLTAGGRISATRVG